MTTITIDDNDLIKVTYTGEWQEGGTDSEYDHTVAASQTVGSYFTLHFTGKDGPFSCDDLCLSLIATGQASP